MPASLQAAAAVSPTHLAIHPTPPVATPNDSAHRRSTLISVAVVLARTKSTLFANQRRAPAEGEAQRNLALGAVLGAVAVLALLLLLYLLRRLDYLRNPIRISDTRQQDVEFNDQPVPRRRRERSRLRRPDSQARSTSLMQLLASKTRDRQDSQRSASSGNSTSPIIFDSKAATANPYPFGPANPEASSRHPFAEATPIRAGSGFGLTSHGQSGIQLAQITAVPLEPFDDDPPPPPKSSAKPRKAFAFPAPVPTSPVTQDITSPRTPKWSITTSSTNDSSLRTALQPPRPRSNSSRTPRVTRLDSNPNYASVVSSSSNPSTTGATFSTTTNSSSSPPPRQFGRFSGTMSPPLPDEKRASAGSRRPPSVSAVEGGSPLVRSSLRDLQPRSPSLPENDEPSPGIGAAY